MREFSVVYPDGLRRGLRAFTNPRYGDEQLIECYNLMPADIGLLPHETIVAVGINASIANYLAIRDQSGVIWYWTAAYSLDIMIYDTLPDFSSSGFEAVDITPPTIPYWLEFNNGFIWPLERTGDVVGDISPPTIGTGYDVGDHLDFMSISSRVHRLQLLPTQDMYWSQL